MLRHAFFALPFLAGLLGCAAFSRAESIELKPLPGANHTVRVSIELEAGGHSLVQSADEAKGDASPQRLPMSVSGKLQYEERVLVPLVDSPPAGTPLAIRWYGNAEAVIKVGETGRTPKLADDCRLVLLESGAERPVLYSPDRPLSREQLDLIDVVGTSYFIDRLLPTAPVSKDDSWSHDAPVMGPLLTLDTVAVCEVQSTLDGFNASFAKMRLAGTVHGAADGAATELEVRAVYLYDRRAKRITQLNLAIRERRSIGGATPGVDATAKLQIRIERLNSSTNLSDRVVGKAVRPARMPHRDLVYESSPLGLRFHHDRNWFVTSEARESVTLRRIDRGDLVAQCTLTALPPKSAGRQTTLEQFQQDVQQSLGKSFGELVSSRQWQNAAGLYCYQLVVRGMVDEVPVEWHYYLAFPESGERVSAAVTIEKPMVDRVGQVDAELFESVQLFPRMPAVQTAKAPASKAVKKPAVETAKRSGSRRVR
jgi:hypothetical protein